NGFRERWAGNSVIGINWDKGYARQRDWRVISKSKCQRSPGIPQGERPETWVTHRTGHIGNTSSPRGGGYALEGVCGDGRETAVCGSPASRRGDGGTLQGVWDCPQDRL